MRVEFGAGCWLRVRLVLYALSHVLIMPLVIGWLYAAYLPDSVDISYLPLLWLLSLLGGFSFEPARKLPAPAAERAGVDSYSRALGYEPALALAVAVLLVGGAVQALLLRTLHARPAAYAVLAGLLAAGLALYAGAARRPHKARLRQAEKVVSLVMLTSCLAVLVEVYSLGKQLVVCTWRDGGTCAYSRCRPPRRRCSSRYWRACLPPRKACLPAAPASAPLRCLPKRTRCGRHWPVGISRRGRWPCARR